MLTQVENDKLKDYRVCVIGCGGIGGNIIEMLGRIGIGHITAVDYDRFEESNLNRQILSNQNTLGKLKAKTAQQRMKIVNPEIELQPVTISLTDNNYLAICQNHHVIVDALDNIDSRFILQKAAEELNIPFVHGAVAGWFGQVTTIFPGEKTLNKLYKTHKTQGIEAQLGNSSFTPALVASIQVSEVIKILLKKGELLRNKVLLIDTLEQEYNIIEL